MTPVARSKEEKKQSSLVELVSIVAVALLLALGIQAVLIKPFRIPSESMIPALSVGQRVLVDRVSFHFTDPERGDIVVFNPPAGAQTDTCGADKPADSSCPRPTEDKADTNFIKRVVGLPGDRIRVIDGRVYLNGERQEEGFIRADSGCPLCDLPTEITIPEDHYFMMGDNRGQSDDSRAWGPVPKDWIIGQAFATYWPPKRIGIF